MAHVRFTLSIASADWSYAAGQVVSVGKEWTPNEIPKEAADAFLSCGHVVDATPPVVESAALEPGETAMLPSAAPKKKGGK